jgi:hypothetical protein
MGQAYDSRCVRTSGYAPQEINKYLGRKNIPFEPCLPVQLAGAEFRSEREKPNKYCLPPKPGRRNANTSQRGLNLKLNTR